MIILYNPSLSSYRTLPTPNFYQKGEVLGIGYDSSVNNYKIVRVPSSYCEFRLKDYEPQIEVLSINLNSYSWRKLPEIETPPYFMAHDEQSLYVNSGIYRLTMDDDLTLIVHFDVSKERFSCVPPPPDCHVSWIGVINHSFCAVFSHPQSYFDIWETHDDLNWKKLITVSKFGDPRRNIGYLHHYPLCFMQLSDAFRSRFTCLSNSAKGCK
ncbi:hypothetical protein TSUD_140420 [Trifolium subterraneum]|uniref:F-box associated beta-propeller type 1 domain-containing protein n=1 Tax=Trifolium subterraneum TaxID=3900 RepID=A0A2Z6PEZ9_TRISU|nr:hypothetical protein TSUD_140420 [Trifolium subterraneum]